MVTVSEPLVILNPGMVDVLVAQLAPVHEITRLDGDDAVNVNIGFCPLKVNCVADLVTLITVPESAVTVMPPLALEKSIVAVPALVDVYLEQIHW